MGLQGRRSFKVDLPRQFAKWGAQKALNNALLKCFIRIKLKDLIFKKKSIKLREGGAGVRAYTWFSSPLSLQVSLCTKALHCLAQISAPANCSVPVSPWEVLRWAALASLFLPVFLLGPLTPSPAPHITLLLPGSCLAFPPERFTGPCFFPGNCASHSGYTNPTNNLPHFKYFLFLFFKFTGVRRETFV